MSKEKHLNAFNELITRLRLIELDMNKKAQFPELIKRMESVYVSTINELISRGKKYLSLNPETDKTIVVAISMDFYISVLEELSIKDK